MHIDTTVALQRTQLKKKELTPSRMQQFTDSILLLHEEALGMLQTSTLTSVNMFMVKQHRIDYMQIYKHKIFTTALRFAAFLEQ